MIGQTNRDYNFMYIDIFKRSGFYTDFVLEEKIGEDASLTKNTLVESVTLPIDIKVIIRQTFLF